MFLKKKKKKIQTHVFVKMDNGFMFIDRIIFNVILTGKLEHTAFDTDHKSLFIISAE